MPDMDIANVTLWVDAADARKGLTRHLTSDEKDVRPAAHGPSGIGLERIQLGIRTDPARRYAGIGLAHSTGPRSRAKGTDAGPGRHAPAVGGDEGRVTAGGNRMTTVARRQVANDPARDHRPRQC